MQQRLLQRGRRGVLPLVEAGEALGFLRQTVEADDQRALRVLRQKRNLQFLDLSGCELLKGRSVFGQFQMRFYRARIEDMEKETVVESLAATKPCDLRVQVRTVMASINDCRFADLASIGEQDVASL